MNLLQQKCLRLAATALLLTSSLTASVCLAEHELKSTDKAPEGVSADIAGLLETTGRQVTGTDGVVVEVWLVKDLVVPAGFKANPFRMYPFKGGQLLGVMHVGKGADFTDFRGQQIAAGTYTLRYGMQPMDGNHVGTSETYDFLLALPADKDKKTAAITSFDDLVQISARSSGSTHPAIFSLLDPAGEKDEPALAHDEDTEHWILSMTAAGKSDAGKPAKVRMVIIGRSEG